MYDAYPYFVSLAAPERAASLRAVPSVARRSQPLDMCRSPDDAFSGRLPGVMLGAVDAFEGFVPLSCASSSRSPGVVAPVDPGVLAVRHAGALEVLRISVGDKNIFESCLLPAVLAWGALVQGLPASASGPFAEADGLFELGVRSAANAVAAAGRVLPGRNLTPTARKTFIENFTLAAALLALIGSADVLSVLCAEVGRTSHDERRFEPLFRFDPTAETLYDFSLRAFGRLRGEAVLRLHWRQGGLRAGDSRSSGARELVRSSVFLRVVRRETLERLGSSAGEREVGSSSMPSMREALFACVRGCGASSHLIDALRDAADAGISAALRERAAETAARDGTRASLRAWGPLLVRAAERLVEMGRWRVNEAVRRVAADLMSGEEAAQAPAGTFSQASRSGGLTLHYAEDGLYLPWPEGFGDLFEVLESSLEERLEDTECRALAEPAIVAAVLAEVGFVERTPSGSPVFRIRTRPTDEQSTDRRNEATAGALRIADPAILLALAAHAKRGRSGPSRDDAPDEGPAYAHEHARVRSFLARDPFLPVPKKGCLALSVDFDWIDKDLPADAAVAAGLQNRRSNVRPAPAFATAGYLKALAAVQAEAESAFVSIEATQTAESTHGYAGSAKEASTQKAASPFFWTLTRAANAVHPTIRSRLGEAVARLNCSAAPERFAIGGKIGGAVFVPLQALSCAEAEIDRTIGLLLAAGVLADLNAVLKHLCEAADSAGDSFCAFRTLPDALVRPVVRAAPRASARTLLAPAQHLSVDAGRQADEGTWGVLVSRRHLELMTRTVEGQAVTAPREIEAGAASLCLVGLTGPDEGPYARMAAAVLRRAAGFSS